MRNYYQLSFKKILKCPQKVVKCIYDTYINEMKWFPEKTYQNWKIKLNIDIYKNYFLNLFNTMYSCTKSTKFRDFQCRVLHSTLVTNDKLSMWGMINDERCSFRHNAPETIIHLLIVWNQEKTLERGDKISLWYLRLEDQHVICWCAVGHGGCWWYRSVEFDQYHSEAVFICMQMQQYLSHNSNSYNENNKYMWYWNINCIKK